MTVGRSSKDEETEIVGQVIKIFMKSCQNNSLFREFFGEAASYSSFLETIKLLEGFINRKKIMTSKKVVQHQKKSIPSLKSPINTIKEIN